MKLWGQILCQIGFHGMPLNVWGKNFYPNFHLKNRQNLRIRWGHTLSLNISKVGKDFFLWKFSLFVTIFSWFHVKISISLRMQAFWKKVCQKTSFQRLCFFGILLNFVGLWCPNHLTYTNSWGINVRMISISSIWHLFFEILRTW